MATENSNAMIAQLVAKIAQNFFDLICIAALFCGFTKPPSCLGGNDLTASDLNHLICDDTVNEILKASAWILGTKTERAGFWFREDQNHQSPARIAD